MVTNRYSVRKISVNGARIVLTRFGRGEPLFLIPGWPFSAKIFLFLEPFLAKKYRVTSFDLPGWAGRSRFDKQKDFSVTGYLDLIEQVFERVYEKEMVVAVGGASVGGTLAMLLALRNQKVSRVMAISPPLEGRAITDGYRFEYGLMRVGYRLPLVGSGLKGFYAFEKKLLRRKCDSRFDYLQDLLEDDYRNLEPKVTLGFALDFFKKDYTDDLKNLDKETILIGFEDDRVVTIEILERLCRVIKNCKLNLLDNGGHNGMAIWPEKVAEVISRER